jgi:ApaG protein
MRSLDSAQAQLGDNSLADSLTNTDVDIFRPTIKPQKVFAVVGHVRYLPEYAEPDNGLYVWSYTVRFANFGDLPIKLLGQKWLIRDADGKTQDVLAAGVGGLQLTLEPGDTYAYESGVPLSTPRGDMTGAFGFRTTDGAPFIIENRRFELQATEDLSSRIKSQHLSLGIKKDVSAFASHLTQYKNKVDQNHDIELRISRLKNISLTGRRQIIRYLLHIFPFNQNKEILIPFHKLAWGLPSIRAHNICITHSPRSQKLDFVIKWWRAREDIDFLESYDLTGDPTIEPNLTSIRLLAAYEALQKIDLSDPEMPNIDRLRLAARLVSTYQRLQKQNLQGVQIGSTPQLRLAHRILKANQRHKRSDKNH